MSTIALEGMIFYAPHGYYKEEQAFGNKYSIDVFLETDLDTAAKEDDLSKTINYESIYILVKAEMQKPSKLLENIGRRIIDKIIDEYRHLKSIKVIVNKFNPPLLGYVDKVSFTIKENL